MKNINPISDHVIASQNNGVWSIKVILDGETFLFEETTNDIRLVSSGRRITELGVRRSSLQTRATLRAREEYGQYLSGKVIA